jgi:hypothetical protein
MDYILTDVFKKSSLENETIEDTTTEEDYGCDYVFQFEKKDHPGTFYWFGYNANDPDGVDINWMDSSEIKEGSDSGYEMTIDYSDDDLIDYRKKKSTVDYESLKDQLWYKDLDGDGEYDLHDLILHKDEGEADVDQIIFGQAVDVGELLFTDDDSVEIITLEDNTVIPEENTSPNEITDDDSVEIITLEENTEIPEESTFPAENTSPDEKPGAPIEYIPYREEIGVVLFIAVHVFIVYWGWALLF